MQKHNSIRILCSTLFASLIAAAPVFAVQEVTGTLGSPDATTTISGKQLPAPAPKFGGKIERNALQSKPWWPPRVVPPKGAPNVLLIMTDDQGFAVPSTFGGVIPTPALDRIAAQTDPAGYPWELYDLSKDWTQYDDVAAKYPQKLKEMEDLFWSEAEKYQVLPLDASKFTRLVAPRPNLTAGRNVFTYSGEMIGTPNGDAPSVIAASYNIKAEVEIPQGGGEGMIVTQGGRFGGYGFYLLKGKPVFTWNMLDLERVKWQAPEVLSPGKHTLEYDFKYDGMGAATLAFNSVSGLGRSGTGILKVDGKEVAKITLPKTIPLTLQWDENFDVGADTLTGVDDRDYQPPFKFTGKLNKLTLTIDRPKLSPADVKKLEEAMHNNQASQ